MLSLNWLCVVYYLVGLLVCGRIHRHQHKFSSLFTIWAAASIWPMFALFIIVDEWGHIFRPESIIRAMFGKGVDECV
jgi:hypothetical protein